jgi:hypothetical protein
MHELADQRRLAAAARRRLSAGAEALLAQWLADGWLHPDRPVPGDPA